MISSGGNSFEPSWSAPSNEGSGGVWGGGGGRGAVGGLGGSCGGSAPARPAVARMKRQRSDPRRDQFLPAHLLRFASPCAIPDLKFIMATLLEYRIWGHCEEALPRAYRAGMRADLFPPATTALERALAADASCE